MVFMPLMWIVVLYQFIKYKWLVIDYSNIGMSLIGLLSIYAEIIGHYHSSPALFIAYIIVTSIVLISSIVSFIIATYINRRS